MENVPLADRTHAGASDQEPIVASAKSVPAHITRSDEISSSNLSLILYVIPVSYNLHMSKAYW